jgi:hypothetical protein
MKEKYTLTFKIENRLSLVCLGRILGLGNFLGKLDFCPRSTLFFNRVQRNDKIGRGTVLD